MKRLISTTLVALLLAVAGGCQKPPDPNAAPTATATAASSSHTPAEKQAANWTQTIKLDDGRKWKANPETTAGIQKMTGLIETTTDPKTLHGELSSALNELVQKCSMTGPAHDNLHLYLVPLMDKLDQLAKVDSPDTATGVINDLKSHLSAYEEYFE